MRMLLIWVAALLLIDFDDLVGRGNCTPPATGQEGGLAQRKGVVLRSCVDISRAEFPAICG
jgi:hypothetical protein